MTRYLVSRNTIIIRFFSEHAFFFFLLCKCYRVGIKNNEKEIIAKDSQMVELKSLCLTHMPPLFLRRAVTFFFFLSVSGK